MLCFRALFLKDDISQWEDQSSRVFLPLQSQTRLIAESCAGDLFKT